MGVSNPCLDKLGNINFLLRRQLAKYRKEDPSPMHNQPVPLTLLLHLHNISRHGSRLQQAIANLTFITFLFLLRPGNYYKGRTDTQSTPFRLLYITFSVGPRRFSALTATREKIARATFVSLTLNNQKNGIKGEAMCHGCTGHTVANPAAVIGRLILAIRAKGAISDTPLAAICRGHTLYWTCNNEITTALQREIAYVGNSLGFRPEDISARTICARGAMDLLLGSVNYNKIKLLGRWRSNNMMTYLHTFAPPP